MSRARVPGHSLDGGSRAVGECPEFSSSGLDQIPAGLRERAQWVCWKYAERKGRRTKVPVCARGGPASATDLATWATFEEASGAAGTDPGIAGVGFVFTADDGLVGIDLDGCIGDDGELVPSARGIIESIDSYTEVSPSGRGVKIFVQGAKPAGARCRSKAIEGFKEAEVYSEGRFFTVTGRHVAGTPRAVNGRQPQIEALCARLWPSRREAARGRAADGGGFHGDDDALVERAGSARNGGLFRALWGGDTSQHGGDDSAADLALCNILAFWTGKDPGRVDRLFRLSGLMRDKWDERHGERSYGQMTIDRAIADCGEAYKPARRSRKPPSAPAPEGGDDDGPPGDGAPIVPIGGRDPKTGRLVLSPKHTLPTAHAYVAEFNSHPEGRTIHHHAGLLLEWRGNRYCEVEPEFVKQRLQPWLADSMRHSVDKATRQVVLVPFESNPGTVGQALETIQTFAHLPASTQPPCWLDGGAGRPPAREVLPCRTMSLHLPSGRGLSPTPALFNVSALDFDHDPDAPQPARWLRFMDELFGDDRQCVDLLQEWMGYCLTGDTSQQKMLLIVGPRRSGKSTIGRVLRQLVGESNVAGPTTGSLAGQFGLQPLIGKSVAVITDARFSGENIGIVVERLLSISGEDTITIDRKHIGSVTMKLPTRITICTNELPRMNDASTALAGRFMVLRLTRSFYDQEDVTLTEQLVRERPGVLSWAIEGWRRLQERGRFVQPRSAEDAIRDLEDLASPVSAFVRDRCVIGPGRRAWVDDLYRAWSAWCAEDGRTSVTNRMTFGRDLAAALPGIRRRRGTGQLSFYEGIGLVEGGS